MKQVFCALILVVFFASFINPPVTAGKKQGITGYVLQESGNRMPSPDEPLPVPKGVKTTVYVYQKTNITQVEREGTAPFYSAIKTKLIRTVQTTSKGYFYVSLPAGSYSLFTKVKGRFYANDFDADNNIATVVVAKNKVSETTIKINDGATY